MPNDEILRLLLQLLMENGRLTRIMINNAPGLPHANYIMRRFGTLVYAYEQIGYHLGTNYDYVASRRSLQAFTATVVTEIMAELERGGLSVAPSTTSKALVINGRLSLAMYVVRCRQLRNRAPEWIIQSRTGIQADHIVAIRMDQENRLVLDYFLLPVSAVHKHRISLGIPPCLPYRLASRTELVQAIKIHSEQLANGAHEEEKAVVS